MAIQNMTSDLDIIQALSDEPNDTDGLSAAELKARFDRAGNLIKTYINTVLIPALTSTAPGSSGASEIGIEPIVGLNGYDNVQDALAGILAVYEAGTVTDGSVTTAKIADGAVTEDKLHSAAVTRNKIAIGAVNANRCDFSSGINFPGPVRLSKNLVLTAGETYGTSSQLPANPVEGQIFFVKVQ